jgi:beta-glucanase (GH16 family)
LTISANQTPGGDPTKVGGWYSGHVQTVNTHGQGFAQRLGYFEARMVFPNSYMAWPAFWLKPRSKWLDLLALELEIDVVEWYGPNDAKRIHATLHQAGLPHHGIQPGVDADLTADWHRYGVLLDEDWITIYVDRHAAARHPMPALHAAQEWYPQLTLSVNGHPNEVSHVAEALNPMRLHVSEVVVWSLR